MTETSERGNPSGPAGGTEYPQMGTQDFANVADAPYDLDDEARDLVRAERLRAALVLLPENERCAIELAYFGGHTYRQVARMLGESDATVKRRMRSGLRRLRDGLGSGHATP